MSSGIGDRGHLGDLLSALLDGELAATEEAEVRRHLASCARCSAEYEDVRTARGWLRALPLVDPPFGFFERLLGESRQRRARSRWGPVAAVAATAAAAVALLGLAPPRESPVSPSVGRLVEAHATGASVNSDPLSRLAPIGVPVTFRR